jgi:hypothetical protein
VIFTSLLFKKEKEKWFEKQNFAIWVRLKTSKFGAYLVNKSYVLFVTKTNWDVNKRNTFVRPVCVETCLFYEKNNQNITGISALNLKELQESTIFFIC